MQKSAIQEDMEKQHETRPNSLFPHLHQKLDIISPFHLFSMPVMLSESQGLIGYKVSMTLLQQLSAVKPFSQRGCVPTLTTLETTGGTEGSLCIWGASAGWGGRLGLG